MIRYVCGETKASLEIIDGRLVLSVDGQPPRTFAENKPFYSMEVIRPDSQSYFVTARRKGVECVVTVLFDGNDVIQKDRLDER